MLEQSGQHLVTNIWRVPIFLHTCGKRQYCHVGNTAKQAGWDCFKTVVLQEILRTQNLLRVEHGAFSEVTCLCQQVGCARKQTSVSHSSTKTEIMSLDAGFRMDGIR